jgi:excisionase family DNA binding protein
MKDQRKIFDIDAVAEYTTLSKATIYKKVCLKEIPYHKIGSRTLFVQDEIDEWILNDGKMVEKLPDLKLF